MRTGIQLRDTGQWEATNTMDEIFICGILQTLAGSKHLKRQSTENDRWTVSCKNENESDNGNQIELGHYHSVSKTTYLILTLTWWPGIYNSKKNTLIGNREH